MNLNLMLNNEAFLHYKINFANNFLNPEFNTWKNNRFKFYK